MVDPSEILNRPCLTTLRDYNKVGYDPDQSKVWLQLSLNVEVERILSTEDDADVWMKNLIDRIDMKIAKGPVSWNCEDHGNEGMSSMVMITTSTCTMHFWGKHLMLDVFSCKHFEVNDILEYIKETLGYSKIRLLFLYDRSAPPFPQIPLHVVYETQNKANGKIYVGVHTTTLFRDDYLGSGVALGNAIKKYGRQNFSNKLLKIFTNIDDAYAYENLIVDEEFVNRSDTYNIALGGRRPKKTNSQLDNESTTNKLRKWIKNPLGECRFTLDHEKLVESGNWEYGRVMNFTEEGRQSIARAVSNRSYSPEYRTEISRRMKGKKNPNKGKIFTKEERLKRYPIKHLYLFQDNEGTIIEVPSRMLCQVSLEYGLSKWFFHGMAHKTPPGIVRENWTYLGKKNI